MESLSREGCVGEKALINLYKSDYYFFSLQPEKEVVSL